MSEGQPQLSVVMATRDRAGMLRDALAALAAQRDVDIEIIVVDDCSSDATPTLLRSAAGADPGRIRTVRLDRNRGPAGARNAGWPLARAEWVAFTDDDCEPDPGWAAAILDVASRTGADIVQGRTEPNPDHPSDTCWRRTVHVAGFSHRYQTCNLAVRRTLLEELGGFDESYTFAGEDADLGWRARALGSEAVYDDRALVLHAVRPHTFRDHVRTRATWAELAQFYARHPEARSTLLIGGLFQRRSHAVIVMGMVGGAAAGALVSWWIPALMPLIYVANSARRPWPGHRSYVGKLPCAALGMIGTMWEIGQFIRFSLRHRTLVL